MTPPLNFLFRQRRQTAPAETALTIGAQTVPIRFVRNPRARRYILRLRPDGSVRATIPRTGSVREARAFAERNTDWIAAQLQRRTQPAPAPHPWQPGRAILYRGTPVLLTVEAHPDGPRARFADQVVPAPDTVNLHTAIERHLWNLAWTELPARTIELSATHGLVVTCIRVRNQRTRWGSCSRRGVVSLNWRLVQTPDYVRDYVILHELMHLREMNHSARFWDQVGQACPRHAEARAWLRTQRGLLRA